MHALPASSLVSPRARRALLALLAVFGLFILWLGNYTDLDIRLAETMFDAGTRSFPWQHAWLTERFGHVIAKRILIGFALVPVILCVGDSVLCKPYLQPWWRMRLRVLGACAIAIPGVTSLLKQASNSHCPWDLQRFGGGEPYYRLLERIPAWVDAGKCLPGGHASSALWLVGMAVFWLPRRPKFASLVAIFMALPGLGLGWLQQMRGAHFLTHTLWSAWVAYAVAIALLSIPAERIRAYFDFSQAQCLRKLISSNCPYRGRLTMKAMHSLLDTHTMLRCPGCTFCLTRRVRCSFLMRFLPKHILISCSNCGRRSLMKKN